METVDTCFGVFVVEVVATFPGCSLLAIYCESFLFEFSKSLNLAKGVSFESSVIKGHLVQNMYTLCNTRF